MWRPGLQGSLKQKKKEFEHYSHTGKGIGDPRWEVLGIWNCIFIHWLCCNPDLWTSNFQKCCTIPLQAFLTANSSYMVMAPNLHFCPSLKYGCGHSRPVANCWPCYNWSFILFQTLNNYPKQANVWHLSSCFKACWPDYFMKQWHLELGRGGGG